MLSHLDWAKKKVDELREAGDTNIDTLLSANQAMKNMSHDEVVDVALYLMGRLNERHI